MFPFLLSQYYRNKEQVSSEKLIISASTPALMGGKHISHFGGIVKLYFYNTVDKKTPTAKKGTNLAVGLS